MPPASPSRLSPAVAELLVVNAVVAWACALLALGDRRHDEAGGHRLEALALLALGLAAHAGIGPSQFRFAADAGMAVGLTALPCMLASLFLVSRNDATVLSLLHANLLCALGVAARHFLCLPVSDIPSQATSLARLTSLGSRLALVALRCLLPSHTGLGYSLLTLLLHDLCLWGLVALPLFTASFTLGEAMVLTQAFALAGADAVACTLVKAGVMPFGIHLLPTGRADVTKSGWLDRDPVLLVLECGLLGAVLAGAVILPLFCRDLRARRGLHGVLQDLRDLTGSSWSLLGREEGSEVDGSGPEKKEGGDAEGEERHAGQQLRLREHKGVGVLSSSSSHQQRDGGGLLQPRARVASGSGEALGSSNSLLHQQLQQELRPLTHRGSSDEYDDEEDEDGLPRDPESPPSSTAVSGSSPSSSLSSWLTWGKAVPTALFLVVLGGYVGLVLLPWLGLLLGHNPLLWVLDFLLAEAARPRFCLWWAALLLGFTRGVVPVSNALKLRRILVRKLFHVLAVVMFVPATYAQPKLLSLAYAVALAALLLLEYARMSRQAPLPLGQFIHKFYAHFLDDRDMGHLVVTHLYLLLGCAFPLWLSWLVPAAKGGNPILPYAGVFVLGIGDSMAAAVGTLVGSHRWPGTSRTLEGSLAMLCGLLVAVAILLGEQRRIARGALLEEGSVDVSGVWAGMRPAGGLLLATALLSLLEAFTSQIDNLILPIFGVSLFNLSFRLALDGGGGVKVT